MLRELEMLRVRELREELGIGYRIPPQEWLQGPGGPKGPGGHCQDPQSGGLEPSPVCLNLHPVLWVCAERPSESKMGGG